MNHFAHSGGFDAYAKLLCVMQADDAADECETTSSSTPSLLDAKVGGVVVAL